MIQFIVLYFFTSPELDLIEIKRTDLPEGSALSDVFMWVVLQNQKVTKLKFVSMNKRAEDEERTFKHAKLHFNKFHAEFNFDRKDFELTTENPESVPANLLKLLETCGNT